MSWVMIAVGCAIWALGGWLTPLIAGVINISFMGFNLSPVIANMIIGLVGFGLVFRGIGRKLTGE